MNRKKEIEKLKNQAEKLEICIDEGHMFEMVKMSTLSFRWGPEKKKGNQDIGLDLTCCRCGYRKFANATLAQKHALKVLGLKTP